MAPLDPDLVIALDKMMRSDLDAWSSLWFWILVGSTIVVAIGIVAEAPEVWKEVGLGRETVAHIRKWWYIRVRRIDLNGWEKVCPELITKNDFRRRWIVKAAFIGWLSVAAGVAGEGIAEYFVNDAETGIRAFDEERLAETTEQAGDAAKSAKTAREEADAVKGIADKARADAKDALAKAQAAQSELARAEADAASAQTAASNALGNASEAKQVAHDATKEIAEAAEELRRVKTARSILHPDKVIAALGKFGGPEYVFSGVGADEDSLTLIRQIDDILQKAGWKRQPTQGGFPAINVFGTNADQSVTVALTSGVTISVDWPEDFTTLQSKPIADLPQYIRAAISLNLNIGSNLYPPQEKGRTVGTVKGASTVIRVSVGQKP